MGGRCAAMVRQRGDLGDRERRDEPAVRLLPDPAEELPQCVPRWCDQRPAADDLDRCRHRRRRDRRVARRLEDGAARRAGLPVPGRVGTVGVEHGDPGADPGGRHRGAADRDPARDLGGPQPQGRPDPPPASGCGADHPRVLLPDPAGAVLQHRRHHSVDLHRDLRAAARGTPHQPRAPRRALRRDGGGGLLRVDLASAPDEGAAPHGEALDHAGRQPDHHDGARHGRDRCRRGRGRARQGGPRRTSKPQRRRGVRGRHRDRDHGHRARPRDLRLEQARSPLELVDDGWPDDQAPVGGRRGDRGDPRRGHGRP